MNLRNKWFIILALPAFVAGWIWWRLHKPTVHNPDRTEVEEASRMQPRYLSLRIFKLLYRWPAKWATHRVLAGRSRCEHKPASGRFTSAEVDQLLALAWRTFDQLAPQLPRHSTFAELYPLLLACLTNSMFDALIATGIERTYAIDLMADIVWKIYERMQFVRHLRSWLLTRDPEERLRISAKSAFNKLSPSYEWKPLPTREGVAFEILRCPVAEHFRLHGKADLCVGSWCNQDYGLAAIWGGRLERITTLAIGGDHCDFRFSIARPRQRNGGLDENTNYVEITTHTRAVAPT